MNWFFTLALAVVLSFMSCNSSNNQGSGSASDQTQSASEPQKTADKHTGLHKITIDSTEIWVEIAQDDATRTRGLMFRNEMPDDQGMLFIFPMPQPLSFWMKNTYLPLDIAFITPLGIISDIHQMAPLDTVPRYSSSVPAQFALEVNQGFFARHGIAVGDTVQLYR